MDRSLFDQTSCIVLSAGSSERMGRHKALLKYDETATFLKKITETYLQAGVGQVIVVVNIDLFDKIKALNLNLQEGVILTINNNPELGRFYSLQTGIKELKPGNSCFFQNIDNPFTRDTILAALLQNKDNAEVIIPTFEGKSGHPVLISPGVAESSAKAIDTEQRINEFLKKFHVKKVEVRDGSILANINSTDDYRNEGFSL